MKICGLLALFLLPVTALAQQEKHPVDREMEAAADRDPTPRGRNEAYSAAREKWDAELNRHYQTLLKKLDPAAAGALRESQRAWLAWRDKEVTNLDRFHDKLEGSMWGPFHTFAVMDLTRQRALQLQHLAGLLPDREAE